MSVATNRPDTHENSATVLSYRCDVTIWTTKMWSVQEIKEGGIRVYYEGSGWLFCTASSRLDRPLRGLHLRRAYSIVGDTPEALMVAIKDAFMNVILAEVDQNAHHGDVAEGGLPDELPRIQPQDVGSVGLSVTAFDPHKDPCGLEARRLFYCKDDHVDDIVGRVNEWIDDTLVWLVCSRAF